MTNYDATNKNQSTRLNKNYRDIDLSFGRNTVTGDVNVLDDAEAVKRAVRNIIQTNHFERPFHPELGSDIRNLLFDQMTTMTAMALKKKILECISLHEPRAKITNIRIAPNPETNSYLCEIDFLVKGFTTPQKVRTSLDRTA